MIRFANPWWFLLLFLLPAQALWYFRGVRAWRGALRYPATELARDLPAAGRTRLRHVLFGLQVLGEAILIVALARPQSGHVEERVTSEGVDIVLVIDVSGTMEALDLGGRQRLDVAKRVVDAFIDGRQADRIGMVVFAGESFAQCPLTLDYGILKMLLKSVTIRMNGAIPDGTAIGMAIATAANRLRASPAKSKVMILLTDGSNNAGIIDPLTGAQAAARVGIKVYTIAVGVAGRAPIRVSDPYYGERIEYIEDSINEDILRQVAEVTGGQFFRATSGTALEHIYDEISHMERTQVETFRISRYAELSFAYRLIPLGIALIVLQFLLGQTVLRTLP